MKCPKCSWHSISQYSRNVYARKQDGTPILIVLCSGHCNRSGCDWHYAETYESKLKLFGFKPYKEAGLTISRLGIGNSAQQ